MILAPTSYGELIDKITILEIKKAKFTEPDKIRHVEDELRVLCQIRDQSMRISDEVEALVGELMHINKTLWEIEDAIRRCESEFDFGPTFIA